MSGKVCTLVGKGPSAAHADRFIEACPETDVCTINDSSKLIRCRTTIRLCFFSDFEMIIAAAGEWSRIHHFLCPSTLHFGGVPDRGLTVDDVPEFPRHRCTAYPYDPCCGDRESLAVRLRERRIAHHTTASAAHSWLALNGYTRIRVIGIDGGTGYAGGLSGIGKHDFTLWRQIHEELCQLLHELFGVETEWFQ